MTAWPLVLTESILVGQARPKRSTSRTATAIERTAGSGRHTTFSALVRSKLFASQSTLLSKRYVSVFLFALQCVPCPFNCLRDLGSDCPGASFTTRSPLHA